MGSRALCLPVFTVPLRLLYNRRPSVPFKKGIFPLSDVEEREQVRPERIRHAAFGRGEGEDRQGADRDGGEGGRRQGLQEGQEEEGEEGEEAEGAEGSEQDRHDDDAPRPQG